MKQWMPQLVKHATGDLERKDPQQHAAKPPQSRRQIPNTFLFCRTARDTGIGLRIFGPSLHRIPINNSVEPRDEEQNQKPPQNRGTSRVIGDEASDDSVIELLAAFRCGLRDYTANRGVIRYRVKRTAAP